MDYSGIYYSCELFTIIDCWYAVILQARNYTVSNSHEVWIPCIATHK